MKTYLRGGYRLTRGDVEKALSDWLAGESGKRNGWRVGAEFGTRDALVDEICAELDTRNLRFRPIHRYDHTEPTNGKVRKIGVESVKQQVCDYLAVNALRPLLKARVGFWQVAGVRGKGQRMCRTALRKWSRGCRWHVKADVRKCYPSISPRVVMRIIERHVASADVLYLCSALLATYDGGIEIGSYFSLCMANLVLSEVYHHVEGLGRRRRGKWLPYARHQIWHMDDFILIGASKRDLKAAIRSVERFMADELGLSLKGWKVAKTGSVERLDLGGYQAWDGHAVLREGIFLRGTRSFARFDARPSIGRARRCASYWGWFRHADLKRCVRRRRIRQTERRAARLVSRHDKEVRNGASQKLGRD